MMMFVDLTLHHVSLGSVLFYEDILPLLMAICVDVDYVS